MTPHVKPGWNQKFLSWFRFVMPVAYLIIGIVVLTGSVNLFSFQLLTYRYGFGALLIGYSLFRSWRIYQEQNTHT